jgi:hypothetical protein
VTVDSGAAIDEANELNNTASTGARIEAYCVQRERPPVSLPGVRPLPPGPPGTLPGPGPGPLPLAKSASDICNTVKSSGRASSRATLLQHLGTDYLQGAPAVQNPDRLIQWSFAPMAPVESPPGGLTLMAYTTFGKKSMQWFDAGKPCP